LVVGEHWPIERNSLAVPVGDKLESRPPAFLRGFGSRDLDRREACYVDIFVGNGSPPCRTLTSIRTETEKVIRIFPPMQHPVHQTAVKFIAGKGIVQLLGCAWRIDGC
jgi:hypothetical protein